MTTELVEQQDFAQDLNSASQSALHDIEVKTIPLLGDPMGAHQFENCALADSPSIQVIRH